MKFNVLLYKQGKVEYYNILPYFKECWNDDSKYEKEKRKHIKSKEDLKQWILDKASYMYRARCQYEFLMANWPFGSYQFNKDMKSLLTSEFNIDDYKQNINFCNIIMKDMYKIDIYEQIKMNIDVITEVFVKDMGNTEIE